MPLKMSETKIGFEYEGYTDNCYVDCNKFDKDTRQQVEKRIWSEHRNTLVTNRNFFDGYCHLAELRFNPITKDDNLKEVITDYFSLIDYFRRKQHVTFKEVLVGEEQHRRGIAELEKETQNAEWTDRREKRNFVGERINYDFKKPLIILDDEIKPFEFDETDRNRGGGLHINISPVEPKKVKDLIISLDKELRPLQNQEFKSKYRTNVLFRYRNYDGVNGVEYMSMGIDFTKLNFDEFYELMTTIITTVNKLLCI